MLYPALLFFLSLFDVIVSGLVILWVLLLIESNQLVAESVDVTIEASLPIADVRG